MTGWGRNTQTTDPKKGNIKQNINTMTAITLKKKLKAYNGAETCKKESFIRRKWKRRERKQAENVVKSRVKASVGPGRTCRTQIQHQESPEKVNTMEETEYYTKYVCTTLETKRKRERQTRSGKITK